MSMLCPIFEHGATFTYQGKTYCTIGIDASRNEIECQTLPFDGDCYWFKVSENGNKVQMI